MNKIFKYPIPVKEHHVLELPFGAQIIRCEDVEGHFFVWAIVNTEETRKERRFLEFFKTGQPIETDLADLNLIGVCKLLIMQELCLYCFENTAKREEIYE